MSVWSEGNTVDSIMADLQLNAKQSTEGFIDNKIARKKARRQMQEIIEKHYKKR